MKQETAINNQPNCRVQRTIKISQFVEFKKQLTTLKGYSRNNVINKGTLMNYNVKLNDPETITVSFNCSREVLDLFNKQVGNPEMLLILNRKSGVYFISNITTDKAIKSFPDHLYKIC